MRALLPAGLWAVLTMSGVGVVAAQTDTDAVRAVTRRKVEELLAAYAPAREMRWQRSAKEPFNIVGSYDQGLRHASRLEIIVSITKKQTIGFRVYPHRSGAYININDARQRRDFMQQLLRRSDEDFFHWAADANLDVFAGFTFTLESGFPDQAIKVVIRSIPLLDESVGELGSLLQ
jgi:hypothetical protein